MNSQLLLMLLLLQTEIWGPCCTENSRTERAPCGSWSHIEMERMQRIVLREESNALKCQVGD